MFLFQMWQTRAYAYQGNYSIHLQVKERISMPNISILPSIEERSEFSLTSKRKINQAKEIDIKESRDAMVVCSFLDIMDPDISTSLTIGQRSKVPQN